MQCNSSVPVFPAILTNVPPILPKKINNLHCNATRMKSEIQANIYSVNKITGLDSETFLLTFLQVNYYNHNYKYL